MSSEGFGSIISRIAGAVSPTGVNEGSYERATITVDALGRITAVSSGTPASFQSSDDGSVRLSTLTDQVILGDSTASPGSKLELLNTGSNAGILVRGGATGQNGLATRVTGDANPRFQATLGGSLLWGDGSSAVDARIYRTGLKTVQFNSPSGATDSLWSFSGALQSVSRRQTFTTLTATTLSLAVNPSLYDVIFCNPSSGNQTITLPNASTAGNSGRRYFFKRTSTSANTVTLTPQVGLINGAASYALAGGTLQGVLVMADSTNWHILGVV